MHDKLQSVKSQRIIKLKEYQKLVEKTNELHQYQYPSTSRSMKILSDVYDILRVSRSMSTINTHPLSSMLNRNLRVFENIKLVL